jgi:putative addiction module component (TIGR02574 family)
VRLVVTIPLEDLEAQALGLPPEDRARLLERLIASFEPKSPAQAAWFQLARRRRDDVRAGRTALVPGDEALARVKARIA